MKSNGGREEEPRFTSLGSKSKLTRESVLEPILTLSSLILNFLLFLLPPNPDPGPHQINMKVVSLNSDGITFHIGEFSALSIETFALNPSKL